MSGNQNGPKTRSQKRIRQESPTSSSANSATGGVAVNNNSNDSRPRIQTGDFGSRLVKLLAGSSSTSSSKVIFGEVPSEGSPTFETLQVISKFLLQNELAQAARRSSTDSGSEEAYITTASYYNPCLQEFYLTQLDRQAAGLRSNTNRESNEGLPKLIAAHRTALIMALDSPDLSHCLSNDVLKTIHEYSLPPTPGNSALRGQFRTKGVRAGHTYFGHHLQVPEELEHLWNCMLQLERDLIRGSSGIAKTYYSIGLAAMVLYGICDVHPFNDGNGRVSRIYCNAVLKCSLDLPFPITICATPQQRQEYVNGVRAIHQAMKAVGERLSYGGLSAGSMSTNSRGALQPIIDMLIARLSHATLQLQTLLEEKARTSKDEEEARIARQVRQRSAQGQCIICLENNPNIATLCCGQAVHLNCIAEWLANGTTCVNCRTPLPRLNVQQEQAEAPQGQEIRNANLLNDALQHAAVTMNQAIQRAIALRNELDGVQDDTTSSTNDTGGDDSTAPAADADTSSTTEDLDCRGCQRNRAAQDCAHHLCGRCCLERGLSSSCRRHNVTPPDDTADDESSTTSTTQDAGQNSSTEDSSSTTGSARAPAADTQYCRFCNNRAAQDCDHALCGRCCVIQGLSYSCQRHG